MVNVKIVLSVSVVAALLLASGSAFQHNWLAMMGWLVSGATQFALCRCKDIAPSGAVG